MNTSSNHMIKVMPPSDFFQMAKGALSPDKRAFWFSAFDFS
jgi:hypothetical protein